MLTIAANSKDEAACIARELERSEPELSQVTQTWTVTVEKPDIPELFNALEVCLTQNGISSVRVTVNDRPYVMEARD